MKRLFASSILIISAYILSALVRTFLVQVYYIPTVSMEPSLYVNDRVLVVKQNIIDQTLQKEIRSNTFNNINLLFNFINLFNLKINKKLSFIFFKNVIIIF